MHLANHMAAARGQMLLRAFRGGKVHRPGPERRAPTPQ
jgi:hypothetical protein